MGAAQPASSVVNADTRLTFGDRALVADRWGQARIAAGRKTLKQMRCLRRFDLYADVSDMHTDLPLAALAMAAGNVSDARFPHHCQQVANFPTTSAAMD